MDLFKKCGMGCVFYAVFMILSSVSVVWADVSAQNHLSDDVSQVTSTSGDGFYLQTADGSRYDKDYAQDFAHCSQHFLADTVPVLSINLSQENYPLCFHGFAIMYSGVSKTALYAAEHLTKSRVVMAGQMTREDNFRPEPRLPSHIRAGLDDYQGLSFDRGHLAPNGDMADRVSQYDSFSLANIIPQDSTHNRNVWRDIEAQVRQLTEEYGELYVVTGVVFATPEVQRAGKMLVPTHLYKAVYVPSVQKSLVYYTHNSANANLELIDLATLQARTGVTVFPSVSQVDMLPVEMPNQSAAKEVGLQEFVGLLIAKIWQVFG